MTPGESVEQAAPIDWQGHAEREAAAIIAATNPAYEKMLYSELLRLVALGWLQGVNFGEHRTLVGAERAFDELRAAL